MDYYNNLFDEDIMEEYIESFESELKVNSPEDNPIDIWFEMLNNNELEDEKQHYFDFRDTILMDLLGYERQDVPFETDMGEGRPVEFVLKKGESKYVVVELKGTKNKDLNKRYGREQSAIEQATNYASIKEETKWAFVCNYDEFRLFNPSFREKYISFRFRELEDEKILKKFLLVFSKFSLIEEDIPKRLLDKTNVIKKEIEDEIYNLLTETKLMLIKEFNSNLGIDNLESIRLAQLIINRCIFIRFMESYILIPNGIMFESLSRDIENHDLLDNTLWVKLNNLFKFMNEGNELKNIKCFGGELFEENLDNLTIRDLIDDEDFFTECYKNYQMKNDFEGLNNILGDYKHTINPIYTNLLKISYYDFKSEVTVDILGRVFENIIGDTEDLINGSDLESINKTVVYTPENVTDYVCKSAIFTCLSKSDKAFSLHDLMSDYEEDDTLDDLQNKLRNIKIMDPACGSGAFLSKSVDVLLEIYEAIHNSKSIENENFKAYEVRKYIIENNIFGVDKNEEAVEITKLSLFLNLSINSKNMGGNDYNLPFLEKNIKCGNSLIDDEDIVGDEAFKWEEKFKEIFDNGGFDVVIGNPPYIRHENIDDNEKNYFKDHYHKTYIGSADYYVYFFERGLDILNNDGILSFICSDKFIKATYGLKLRELLLSYNIVYYDDLNNLKIFDKSSVDTLIIGLQKRTENLNKIFINKEYLLPQDLLDVELFIFDEEANLSIMKKIRDAGQIIKDINSITIHQGGESGLKSVFNIDKRLRDKLITQNNKNIEIIKPLVKGANIDKWFINYEDLYIIFTRRGIDIDQYPVIKSYLLQFKEDLAPKQTKSDRKGRKMGNYKWFELQDTMSFYKDFEKPKLMWGNISQHPQFAYDDQKFYPDDTTFYLVSDSLNLKYILALLNSNLLFWYLKEISYKLGDEGHRSIKKFIELLPIINLDDEGRVEKIIALVDELLFHKSNLFNMRNGFMDWLYDVFNLDIKSNNLIKFYELEFKEFSDLMEKGSSYNPKNLKDYQCLKKGFSIRVKNIKKCIQIIGEKESELNEIIYNLYGLNENEIEIIEESSNNQ